MRVIVNHQRATKLAQNFPTATRATERLERHCNVGKINSSLEPNRQRRESVLQIVLSRHTQTHITDIHTTNLEPKRCAAIIESRIHGAIIATDRHAIRERAQTGEHLLESRPIAAVDDHASILGVTPEGRMQSLERGVIIVGRIRIVRDVIVFDIRDHRDLRFEVLKIWIGLVHLGNKICAAPELRVAADLAQFATDHAGWITARTLKDRRNHRRCAGLTVRANHADAVTRVHQLAQDINAFHDFHTSRSSRNYFGFGFTDCGAGHKHIDRIRCLGLNVLRTVTLPDFHASSLELSRQDVQLPIATRDSSATIEQDLRQTAHADATDAHEVIVRAHWEPWETEGER